MESAGGTSLLGEIIRERFTPVVMVLPTLAVEESCQKNNTSFLDLMRRFCDLRQIDVPVRTASDQPYRLHEFCLRMFYAAEISQAKAEIAEEYLLQFVNESSDDAFVEFHGGPQNIESILKVAQLESPSSWFQRYSKEFIRSIAFSEHEAIDHPVACLLVVSSRDENPVNKFVDLFNTDKIPALMHDGVMDPKLLKYYLLLHDNQDGPPDWAKEILSEMKGTFGSADCSLLCINSGLPQHGAVEKHFLTSDASPSILNASEDTDELVNSSLQKENFNGFLDEADLNEISEFMLNFSSKHIIPYMEQKIRLLNQQVVATKKGLRNQIKNLWWRKGKEEMVDAINGPMYTFSSTESQIRVLADYALMLCDYELALSNYRLLSSDYKTDKSWKRYAGVQEMIGLSLFMLDQSRKEAEYCMETAFTTYQKLGSSGQRFAIRCALWWAEMLKARGQYKDAAVVYSRTATDEPSLRAGILLEQAAYCYLCAPQPMLNKYGFHLVLAGNRYNACGQRKHAIRAFMSILSVYEGQGWNYISDHVHFHLGRLSAFLGNFDVAVHHFMKLLACSHESPSMQATFLREFIYVVQNWDSKQMLNLDLPAIDMETLRVHFEDQRTYVSADAAGLPEDMWLPLEAGLIPTSTSIVTNWLDAASVTHSTNEQAIDFNACIAGEELTVDVEFRNPLQIPLNMTAVSLVCKFVSESSKEKLGRSKTFANLVDITEKDTAAHQSRAFRVASESDLSRDSIKGGPDEGQHLSLSISEEAFDLKATEKLVAHLKVTPHSQGILVIVGVKWILSGVVTGYRDFVIQHVKKKLKGKTKSHQEPPPHKRLEFHVLKHAPRMEVSLHGMPRKVNAGELHRLVLELSNTSDVPIHKIKFNTNHMGVILVGDPEDLDAEFPVCLEALGCKFDPLHYDDRSHQPGTIESVFLFPEDIVLEGGSTLLWPLWLHAREAGTLLINNVLYYEADKATAGLQYRTVRMTHNLHVLPSLQISVHITQCLLNLEHSLLRLDIANQHSSESFWLRQVSCVGSNWLIAPLLPPTIDCVSSGGETVDRHADVNAAFISASVCPSQLLPAGQTLSLFFQLWDGQKENSHGKGPGSIPLSEFSSNVRLGPPSSSEPLIDIASGPLSKFHMLERQLQKCHYPSVQEKHVKKNLLGESSIKLGAGEGMVDIILISEQQDESVAVKPATMRDSQKLATHHMCHCSVQDSTPLVWMMEGPKTVVHNFNDTFCEISLFLIIKNRSRTIVSVKVETLSSTMPASTASVHSVSAQTSLAGWYDLSLETNTGSAVALESESEVSEKHESARHEEKAEVLTPCAPFIWCSLSSSRIMELKGGTFERVPLCVTVFAPGIYDLSGYKVSWHLFPERTEISNRTTDLSGTHITRSKSFVAPLLEQTTEENGKANDYNEWASSGFGAGHPFILTVLQANAL